ncbi:MAG TPA: CdaR family protein [Polyangiaceae bacterium]|jgi:YbbR domain-containing protein
MTRLVAAVVTWLREAFTDNVGLKALSLTFALGLFTYLHGQQDQQQRAVAVNVVLRLPPDSARRELMTPVPASITLTLRGPARALDRLLQTNFPPVELDVRDGQRSTIVFDDKMLSLPEDVEIALIDPPSIDLDWQDIVTRQIPVQASITGQPAEGFLVSGEPQVDPKEITVRGPVSLVEVMQFARLAAFDVTGLTEGVYRRRIAIDAPPARVSYIGPQNATVTVTIARRVSEAKFEKRPVEVIGMASGVVTPRTVDVTVVGPPEVVRALRPEQVVPRADLTRVPGLDVKNMKHGSATLKVVVDLAHAEAEVQPPSVNVKW